MIAVLFATGVPLLLGPLSWQNKEIQVCIWTGVYTHIQIFLYVISCFHIKWNVNSHWLSPILIHFNMDHSNLLPLIVCDLHSNSEKPGPDHSVSIHLFSFIRQVPYFQNCSLIAVWKTTVPTKVQCLWTVFCFLVFF